MYRSIDVGHSSPQTRLFRSPRPSQATKIPGFRSKNSHKGCLVGGSTPTRIYYHSSLEQRVASVLLIRHDILEIREQPPRFEYVEDGTTRTYTFDFLVTLTDGRRYLVEVKPQRIVDATNLRAWLEWLGTQLPAGCADGILVLTERHLPRALVMDAELIHAARRQPPGPHDDAVMSVMSNVVGAVSIADLVAASGGAGQAFRAVVRRIGAGDLVLASARPITHASRVALPRAIPA